MKKLALAGAALLAIVLIAGASMASGDSAPEFLLQFPEGEAESGAGAGELHAPSGVVTDTSGKRVYVSDIVNSRIDVFSPWGEFIEAFGWGVKNGASELQNCTKASGCFVGLKGAGRGQFDWPEGLAVDSTDNLYVVDLRNHRVEKFSPSGEFLLMFGGNVNRTKVEEVGSTEAQRNLCTAASGDVCQAGSTGSGDGQFEEWLEASSIAVGAGGNVYIGDKDRIQVFEAGGVYLKSIHFGEIHADDEEFPAAGYSGALAIDPPSGDFYFAFHQLGTGYESPQPNVYRLSPAGKVVGKLEVDSPKAITVDPEGNVFVVELGRPTHEESEILEFDSSGKALAVVAKSNRAPTALGSNRVGDLYATNVIFIGEARSWVDVYGPTPSEIEPAPERAPTIAGQYAVSASASGAVLRAQINPHFFGSSTYYVEYGLEPCKDEGCASTPAPPGSPLAGGEKGVPLPTSGVPISGLAPATTYHYRFVSVSGKFTVKGAGEDSNGKPLGLEGTFTTRPAGTPALPDGRAYEKVSPADKNSGEAGLTSEPLGGLTENNLIVRPLQASPSGAAITFTSFSVFGQAEGGAATSQYLSRRGASSWVSENVTPAARGFAFRDPVRGFSSDLSSSAVVQFDPPLVPGAPVGIENLYVRDENGALTLLTPEAPPGAKPSYCIGYGGASADFGQVFFMATGALTPDALEGPGQSLYEWTTEGGLKLVSVMPDGSPAAPSFSTGFGSMTSSCQSGGVAYHAISADGSRVVWTYGGKYAGNEAPLFARVDGAETIQLDAVQAGTGPSGNGFYRAASADGSKVFFTAPGKLVPGSKAGDLYRYDFEAPEGEQLSDLSIGPKAAEVLGVLGAGEDGSAIYFAARGVLSGVEENSEGQKAQAGGSNVYRWSEEGGIRFVATLDGASDETAWRNVSLEKTSRVSNDGNRLAFGSTVPLTGFDNTDQATGKADREIFLYQASSNELTCASCNPTGARPIGPATLPPWTTPFEQPRNISEGGGRLFFQSKDALALKDTNGRQDVYQFELVGTGSCSIGSPSYNTASGGCQDLISSGESGDDAYLDDASASGADVFFATRQRLLPSDQDDHYDIYDARVGGGLPEPLPPSECNAEACRPGVPPPGAAAPPASSTFSGPGNEKEVRKPKKHKPKKHRGQKKHKSKKHKRQNLQEVGK